MNKFCELKIFPGRKGEPQLIIVGWHWFEVVMEGLPVFVRAEDMSAFAAVGVILDLDIAVLWGLVAQSYKSVGCARIQC